MAGDGGSLEIMVPGAVRAGLLACRGVLSPGTSDWPGHQACSALAAIKLGQIRGGLLHDSFLSP
jgi:hypothetical protein